MNLLRRTRMFLDKALIDARKPVRELKFAASVGLVAGYGVFIIGAAPLMAAVVRQDEGHQQDHDVHRQQVHSDADGNIEIVVVQDDESGDVPLLKKFKSDHDVQLHQFHSGKDENVEVIVLGDDEEKGASAKLHRHLVELLHHNNSGQIDAGQLARKLKSAHKIHVRGLDDGKGGNIKVVVVGDDEQPGKRHNRGVEFLHRGRPGKVDHHELANRLRKIADQLDGTGHGAHAELELHSELKMIEGEDIGVLIERIADSHNGSRSVEMKPGSGKHVAPGSGGDAKKLIIEKLFADHRKGHVHGDQAKVILRALGNDDPNVMVEKIHIDREDNANIKAKAILHALEHDADHNIIVDKINVDQDRSSHAHEFRFRNATTSDEALDQDLRELRKELQRLREEVNKLRSDRPAPTRKRDRLKEEHETGLLELVSDSAI